MADVYVVLIIHHFITQLLVNAWIVWKVIYYVKHAITKTFVYHVNFPTKWHQTIVVEVASTLTYSIKPLVVVKRDIRLK